MRTGRQGKQIRDKHRRIIAAGEPACHLCGEPIDYTIKDGYHPDSFTIDHITPINRGGPDTLDNLAAAHRRCNRDKGDRLPDPAPGVTFITDRTW